MSHVCGLCRNKNQFRGFVKHYKDSFDDICQKNYSPAPNKVSYSHLTCSAFFLELEIQAIDDNEALMPNPEDFDNNELIIRLCICNGKNLKENVMDDCNICLKPINNYFLIPCLVKGCKNFFHYHCTKDKNDTQRIKIAKDDNSAFKYGFLCPTHSTVEELGGDIILRNNSYKIVKKLSETELDTELAEYNDKILLLSQPAEKAKTLSCQIETMLADIDQMEVSPICDHGAETETRIIKKVNKITSKSGFNYDTFGDFYVDSDEETCVTKQIIYAAKEDHHEDAKIERKLNKENHNRAVNPKNLEKSEKASEVKKSVKKKRTKSFRLTRAKKVTQSAKVLEDPVVTEKNGVKNNKKKGTNEANHHEATTETSSQSRDSPNDYNFAQKKLLEQPKPKEYHQPLVTKSKKIDSQQKLITEEEYEEIEVEEEIEEENQKKQGKKSEKKSEKKFGKKSEQKPEPEEKPKQAEVKHRTNKNQQPESLGKTVPAMVVEQEEAGKRPTVVVFDEEKSKAFWKEIDEQYFGEEYSQKLDALNLEEVQSSHEMIKAEKEKAYASITQTAKRNFAPKFRLKDFSLAKNGQNQDSHANINSHLKVLYELASEDNFDIERSYKPGLELDTFMLHFQINEDEIEKNPFEWVRAAKEIKKKYHVLTWDSHREIAARFEDSLKPIKDHSKYTYFTRSIENESSDPEDLHRIFQLKHVESVSYHEALELKAKILCEKNLQGRRNNVEVDDITKQVILYNLLLDQFITLDNNARKEIIISRIREQEEQESFFNTIRLLDDQAYRLDDERKMALLRKYMKYGCDPKTEDTINQMRLEAEEFRLFKEGKPITAANLNNSRTQMRKKKKKSKSEEDFFETDCCICFHNYTGDNNPIIYCSGCGGSFHQYCYGIIWFPSEDFYCDLCTHLKKNKQEGESPSHPHIEPEIDHDCEDEAQKSGIQCKICRKSEFPLKLFENYGWFHITCLFWHNMSTICFSHFILIPSAYYKDGMFAIKPEKMSQVNSNKAKSARCSICSKRGFNVPCKDKGCKKSFHALCAYLEGYEVTLAEVKGDKMKNSFTVQVACPSKAAQKNNAILRQKYYRRYTTNFQNTSRFDTFEEFMRHENGEESSSEHDNTSTSNSPQQDEWATEEMCLNIDDSGKRGFEEYDLYQEYVDEGDEYKVHKKVKQD